MKERGPKMNMPSKTKSAIYNVYQSIAHDLPLDTMDPEDIAEACLAAGRLTPDAQTEVNAMIDANGYNETLKHISDKIIFI
jgi:hypothetical protein